MLENNNKNGEAVGSVKDLNVSALMKDRQNRPTDKVPAVPATEDKKSEVVSETEEPSEESATPETVVEKNDGKETDEDANNADDSAKLEDKTRRPKKGIAARFKSITAERDTARTENESLRARVAELEKGSKAAKPEDTKQEQATSEFSEKEPTYEDFDNINEYVNAHSEWMYKKKESEKAANEAKRTGEQKYQEMVVTFTTRGKDLEKELGLEAGEFGIVVGDPELSLYDGTQHLLLTSEHGARIAYEIASDDELKAKVVAMNPVKQLAYVAKLEAKYEAASPEVTKPEKKETQVSKAKKPAKPLPSGKSASATPDDWDSTKGDMVAFAAKRREARAAKGKGWR